MDWCCIPSWVLADYRFNLEDEVVELLFPISKKVDPLPRCKFISKCFLRSYILDPHGDHYQTALTG